MNFMLTFILFILMLTAIVTIHEFGHFIACRIFNVYVSEFSIGMGKLLYQKKGKETAFSIRLLPIGGFCAIAGDNDTDLESSVENIDEIPYERTLKGIAKWKKIIILLSGVLMNFILALLIVSMAYLSIGKAAVSPKPIINEVVVDSPAYNVGLQSNDEIIYVEFENGYSIKPDSFSELSDFLLLYEKGSIELKVLRDGKQLEFKLIPKYNKESESYIIGITSYENGIEDINIFNCFKFGFLYLVTMFKLIWTTLIGLFRGVGLNNLSGPVGIYNATSEAVSLGFESYFLLIGLLSFNIGIFNLIPIPALDGGRVILTIVEAIIGHPIDKKLEEAIMTASVILFIGLMIFATSQDIFKLFR